MTDSTDSAANLVHRAQAVDDIEAHWSEMRASATSSAASFSAMLFDIFGEAPAPEADPTLDLNRQARDALLADYLDGLDTRQRIAVVEHYGIWGDPVDPETTAAELGVARAQYDEILVTAKVALETRKNEFFKELALTPDERR